MSSGAKQMTPQKNGPGRKKKASGKFFGPRANPSLQIF
jgi:hypothetical protein